jgi:protein-L-isoaspartate(D-aspartate) O-methyltransferase
MNSILLSVFLSLCIAGLSRAEENDPFYPWRKRMVDQQIRQRGVGDPHVLEAMLKVPRHLFVPEDEREWAYEDHPLSIGNEQTISQPYIVAFMTELLRAKATDKVLEIGTGSGYQAAVLANIVQEVYTIEIIGELADSAEKRLQEMGYQNVFVRHGDGYEGWPEKAPFDGIIVTAAPKEIPVALVAQLKTGGRMILPVGSFYQELYVVTKTSEGFTKENVLPVRFVPMIKDRSKTSSSHKD